MAGSDGQAVDPANAEVTNAIIGLGLKLSDRIGDAGVDGGDLASVNEDYIVTDSVANATNLHASLAKLAALKTFVIAGGDNTTSHDYTATGLTAAGSIVCAALAFKHQDTVVAAVAGTITPGANKITVAGGDDLSTGFTLVFIVFP